MIETIVGCLLTFIITKHYYDSNSRVQSYKDFIDFVYDRNEGSGLGVGKLQLIHFQPLIGNLDGSWNAKTWIFLNRLSSHDFEIANLVKIMKSLKTDDEKVVLPSLYLSDLIWPKPGESGYPKKN